VAGSRAAAAAGGAAGRGDIDERRHLTRDPDIDAVTALIAEAVAELMLPRFGHLRAEDVRSKASVSDPEDLVTVVDREMEERLTRGLRDLTPSAVVVGEEAVHKTPGLLAYMGGDDPLWLLDPLDGTRNFSRGNADFGVPSVGRFQPLAECGCAAVEYTNVLEARKEFALYYRLLPWDHAAPALILSEGGGCVEHLNGQPYRVRSGDQVTLVARDGRISRRVRGWLGGLAPA